ncbi:MAG: hypothetical protein QOE70_5712 [Chthoniobacter sp.]|jgi:hypothetical protein|nr:hypothetical protein [Chthoniobacter sp.]
MTTHYNPPLKIREIGRLLKGNRFSELRDALGDGELLFELLQEPGNVYYAILIDSQATFDEFQKLSVTHSYTKEGYFAVPWSDAEDGADDPLP